MKKLIAIALLALPMAAAADHVDVFEFTLKDGCDKAQYMAIVKDFNTWGANYGYKAEILTPIYSNNLKSWYWLGRSRNATAFGKAYDAWEAEAGNADSAPAKLGARFAACTNDLGRRSYEAS